MEGVRILKNDRMSGLISKIILARQSGENHFFTMGLVGELHVGRDKIKK